MKKIVFVANRLGGGGAERVLTLLANQFKQNGHDVTIISLNRTENSYRTETPVVELGLSSGKQQIMALRRKIKQMKPDTVIAFEYHVAMKTVLAAMGLKCKVIVSERNDPHKLDGQPVKKAVRNFLYGCADVLVCQTNDARAYFSKRIQKKSVVIMNPVSENLPKWDPENHNKTIINFCRLEKQKNIPMLLEAFQKVHEKHPDYSLAIYGTGTEDQHIRDLIGEVNLSDCVSLAPFACNIHEIASQCAMFVSSSDYEGLSNSMLEAMAMGMPVVCTDCPIGGARMVIQNGRNGRLVPVRDPLQLVEAMDHIIENKDIAKMFGENARRLQEQLSTEKIVSIWEDTL